MNSSPSPSRNEGILRTAFRLRTGNTTARRFVAIGCVLLVGLFVVDSGGDVIFRHPDHRRGSDCYLIDTGSILLGAKIPVILIHGINLEGVPAPTLLDGWSNFIGHLNDDPELAAKFKSYQFSYKSNAESVNDLSENLSVLLSRVSEDPTFGRKSFIIVAHSMGGLIARALLEKSDPRTNQKWGDRVLRLITLATPHHGTPLSNQASFGGVGALAERLSFDFDVYAYELNNLVETVWNGPKYYQNNRFDLLWDNYDDLFTYSEFSSVEENRWLQRLNDAASPSRIYDEKMIAYAGTFDSDDHSLVYRLGNSILRYGLGISGDGVVPTDSAFFTGRLANSQLRFLPDHDHTQMWQGKDGDRSLFERLGKDLLETSKLVESQFPTISSVSPRTLSTSEDLQPITIRGTGFTSASRLIFNGDIPSDPDRLEYVSPTKLEYEIRAIGAGEWTVQVLNGAIKSAAYTFYVVSGGAQLTGLSINGPSTVDEDDTAQFSATAYFSDGSSEAVTSSSSWIENSSVTSVSSGLLRTSAVTSNTEVIVSASYTAGGITRESNAAVTVMNVDGTGGVEQYELISNGGFESGKTRWSANALSVGNSRSADILQGSYPRTGGTWYAYVGDRTTSSFSALGSVHQLMATIPQNADSIVLTFFLNIVTEESGSRTFDKMDVNLRTSSDGFIKKVGSFSEADKGSNIAGRYRVERIDLTTALADYKGERVILQFYADTDSSASTIFRIDDVSVTATTSRRAVLLGISGPSSILEGEEGSYSAVVIYCDGSLEPVNPDWREDSSVTRISSSGQLRAENVRADTSVRVSATYSLAGIQTTVSKSVAILNAATKFSFLAIDGPTVLNELDSADFTARAVFSDGSSEAVSAENWAASEPGIMSNSGVLLAGEVQVDTISTVSASHTIDGVTRTARHEVMVINKPPPRNLVSLNIIGPSTINENSTSQYTATAFFSDGSSESVVPTWSEDSASMSVSALGLLQAGEVEIDTPAAISASHTIGGDTRDAAKRVTILNTSVQDTTPPTVTVNQALDQSDPTTNGSIEFTVVFSEPVTGFGSSDVHLEGTAGATIAVVSGAGPMYTLVVSGMTQGGTVILSIPPGIANDAVGNRNLASTNVDNSVDYSQITTRNKPRSDFDLDQLADVLWYRSSTRQIGAWLKVAQTVLWAYYGGGGPGWAVIGTGDMDADGASDILWRHQESGQVGAWLINGSSPRWHVIGVAGLGWELVGVGDFDLNGQSDVAWRHPVSRQVGVWFITNGRINWHNFGAGGLGWEIATVGDVNNDGLSDVVWHCPGTGEAGAWLCTDGDFQWYRIGAGGPDWEVVGTGDFNADGHTDLLWTHRKEDRSLGAWYLNDGVRGRWRYFAPGERGFEFVSTGDLDGDGISDILWRNPLSNEVQAWLIRLDTFERRLLGRGSPGWEIVRNP